MLSLLAGLTIVLAPEAIVISNVSVIDVEKGSVQKAANVLIRDGVIAEISPKALKATGAKEVNGSGKYLIPGLWDSHVHCWSDQVFFPLFLANGVTGIRDMFGPITMVKGWKNRIEEGTMLGPRIVAAGRIVDGPKPIWAGSVAVSNAEEGKKAVETVAKEGSEFVKVYSLLSRDSYFAIAEEAKKRKMVFCGHVPNSVTAKEGSEAGQKSFEHLYTVLAGCCDKEKELMSAENLTRMQRVKAMVESYNPTKAKDLFQTFRKNKTWQCPTLTVLNALAHLDDEEFLKDPRISLVSPFITRTWDVRKDQRFSTYTKEDFDAMRLRFKKEMEIVGLMAKEGVGILAGTDTPNPYAFPGYGIHDELSLLVKAGLTPAQALRTATINPARYFGLEKKIGTVHRGKDADLVLLDANPLSDIGNTKKIAAVFVRGRHLDRPELDGMLKPKTVSLPDNGHRYLGLGCGDH